MSEYGILFQSIFETILGLDSYKIYDSNLGRFFKQLMTFVESKIEEDVHYERIYTILEMGVQKIRKKLIEEFFSYGRLKVEKSCIAKRNKKINKIKKEINNSKSKIAERKTKKEKTKSVEKDQTQSLNTSFRVCKKIAEILFKKKEF